MTVHFAHTIPTSLRSGSEVGMANEQSPTSER